MCSLPGAISVATRLRTDIGISPRWGFFANFAHANPGLTRPELSNPAPLGLTNGKHGSIERERAEGEVSTCASTDDLRENQ
jgi:hypothetical protein